MKDRSLLLFRIVLAIALIGYCVGFLYIAYPDFKEANDIVRVENNTLKDTIEDIEEVMVDPEKVQKEIEGLEETLNSVAYNGHVDDSNVYSDILNKASGLGIELTKEKTGRPVLFGDDKVAAEQLYYTPVEIEFTADVDEAIALVKLYENSDEGIYKIEEVSSSEEGGSYRWYISMRLLYYGAL